MLQGNLVPKARILHTQGATNAVRARLKHQDEVTCSLVDVLSIKVPTMSHSHSHHSRCDWQDLWAHGVDEQYIDKIIAIGASCLLGAGSLVRSSTAYMPPLIWSTFRATLTHTALQCNAGFSRQSCFSNATADQSDKQT
jgi:hypothetical protein